jgi:hypothetical protein
LAKHVLFLALRSKGLNLATQIDQSIKGNSDFKLGNCRKQASLFGHGERNRDVTTAVWNLGPAVYRDGSLFTPLFDLLDHAIEIGIARAKASCEPTPAALCNHLAVSNNLELTSLPSCNDGFNVEALLDEGHETRDLCLVVLSCRAMYDFDLHQYSNFFV